ARKISLNASFQKSWQPEWPVSAFHSKIQVDLESNSQLGTSWEQAKRVRTRAIWPRDARVKPISFGHLETRYRRDFQPWLVKTSSPTRPAVRGRSTGWPL